MRVLSHPEAEAELEAAAVWYDERKQGLGIEFLNEFESTLRRLLIDPERYHRIRGNHRKINFRRFPLAVVYRASGECLYIIAVMHLHRRPFYWARR